MLRPPTPSGADGTPLDYVIVGTQRCAWGGELNQFPELAAEAIQS